MTTKTATEKTTLSPRDKKIIGLAVFLYALVIMAFLILSNGAAAAETLNESSSPSAPSGIHWIIGTAAFAGAYVALRFARNN